MTAPAFGNLSYHPHPYNGFQHEGQPKGQYESRNRHRYTVRPRVHVNYLPGAGYAYDDVALLLLPDAKGICHDSMLLADQFAAAGITTYVSGYTGVAVPTVGEAKNKKDSDNQARKIVDDDFGDIVGGFFGSSKRKRILLAGYGSGARHVLRLLCTFDRQDCAIVAAFIASPDYDPAKTAFAYGNITKPLSLAFGDDINTSTAAEEREKIRQALVESWMPYQITLQSHARDGFAVRRAVGSTVERLAKREAFVQALRWFNYYLFGDK